MAKCSFCGNTVAQGTGKFYVKDDGKILKFDTNKCEKMMIKFNKKPHLTKWTATYYQKTKKKSKEETTKAKPAADGAKSKQEAVKPKPKAEEKPLAKVKPEAKSVEKPTQKQDVKPKSK